MYSCRNRLIKYWYFCEWISYLMNALCCSQIYMIMAQQGYEYDIWNRKQQQNNVVGRVKEQQKQVRTGTCVLPATCRRSRRRPSRAECLPDWALSPPHSGSGHRASLRRPIARRLAETFPRTETLLVTGGNMINLAHPAVLDFVGRVLAQLG